MAGDVETELHAVIDATRHEVLVDHINELIEWKKSFEEKQLELINWQLETTNEIKTILKGCLILVSTDEVISDRVTLLGQRIDIVNKRLRKMENKKVEQTK